MRVRTTGSSFREAISGTTGGEVLLLGGISACAWNALMLSAGAFAARNVDVALTGVHALEIVLGTIAASALIAMLGVTVGALVRNQVGAIGALAAYTIGVETLLFATVPSIGRYLPGQAANALAGLPTDDLLTPPAGAVVLVAWTLVFVALATLRTDRSDI